MSEVGQGQPEGSLETETTFRPNGDQKQGPVRVFEQRDTLRRRRNYQYQVGEAGRWEVQRWLLGDVHLANISWEPSTYQVLGRAAEMKRKTKIWEQEQEKLPKEAGFLRINGICQLHF